MIQKKKRKTRNKKRKGPGIAVKSLRGNDARLPCGTLAVHGKNTTVPPYRHPNHIFILVDGNNHARRDLDVVLARNTIVIRALPTAATTIMRSVRRSFTRDRDRDSRGVGVS